MDFGLASLGRSPSGKFKNSCEGLVDGSARVDDVRGDFPQPRFDGPHEPEYAGDFLGAASVRTCHTGGEPLDQECVRRGQEHDAIETREDRPHILRATADEEDVGVLAVEEVPDAFLPPDPVAARSGGRFRGRRVAAEVDGDPLRSLIRVEVDGLIAAGGRLADQGRLPGRRHPCDEASLHDPEPIR